MIVEKLVGATGDTTRVLGASRSLAIRVLPIIAKAINEGLETPIDVTLQSFEVARIADIRPAPGGYHAMTIAPSAISADALLMVIDAEAIALLVSALFGGDPALPAPPIERPLSPTELAVVNLAFHHVATAVNGTGARALDIRFPIPPAITGEELQKQVLRDGPAARLVFEIATPASRGTLQLFMPHRVLLFQRREAGDAEAEGSAAWESRFTEEIRRSAVTLEATMPLGAMTLGRIAALTVGEVIEIPESAPAETVLSTRDKPLFVCDFGRLGGNFTVRVREPHEAGRSFIDGILPATAAASPNGGRS